MKDLAQVEIEIRDSKTKPLVSEAIRCYNAGAYRAALVSLWIAVNVDLIQKLQNLSDTGDGAARDYLRTFTNAIETRNVSQAQKFERTLLEKCTSDFDLLTHREYQELQRLREDRDLCAHPGFTDTDTLFQPGNELVRAHIIAAHLATFSHPPIAGKTQIQLLEREITGDGWPDTSDYFVERFFKRSTESVRRNLVKTILKWSLRPESNGQLLNPRVGTRARKSILRLAEEAPLVFNEALESVLLNWEDSGKLDDDALIRAVGTFGAYQVFWDLLPSTAERRASTLIAGADDRKLLTHGFLVGGVPLRDEYASRWRNILGTLNADDLVGLQGLAAQHDLLLKRAFELVEESGNFRAAEANLRVIETFASWLRPQHIEALEYAIKHNDYDQVRLAAATEAILMSILDQQVEPEKAKGAWASLAEWLSMQGEKDGGFDYRYLDLRDAVEALGD
ncbi:hypothetical protein FPH17_09300 [Corynebacterium godavarianum]|uniref:Uncharacterized protein n=1 Tax=Corynebacterium godavarianum TaxID=2054421 RepID=A0ABY3DZR1_9CORY|nr:hypothetical protein [Corynebacterium godavarianum]MBL7284684.1 hypothetical protein [Corynebacterium godavarianum]TSJ72832.1 hypothetical protein FPH17_09300 [Corynebacterium godavarianum]